MWRWAPSVLICFSLMYFRTLSCCCWQNKTFCLICTSSRHHFDCLIKPVTLNLPSDRFLLPFLLVDQVWGHGSNNKSVLNSQANPKQTKNGSVDENRFWHCERAVMTTVRNERNNVTCPTLPTFNLAINRLARRVERSVSHNRFRY